MGGDTKTGGASEEPYKTESGHCPGTRKPDGHAQVVPPLVPDPGKETWMTGHLVQLIKEG